MHVLARLTQGEISLDFGAKILWKYARLLVLMVLKSQLIRVQVCKLGVRRVILLVVLRHLKLIFLPKDIFLLLGKIL